MTDSSSKRADRAHAASFQRGDRVRAGRDGSFVGNLLGRGSDREGFEFYQRDMKNMNVPVWAVEDLTTGEVRFFMADTITLDG